MSLAGTNHIVLLYPQLADYPTKRFKNSQETFDIELKAFELQINFGKCIASDVEVPELDDADYTYGDGVVLIDFEDFKATWSCIQTFDWKYDLIVDGEAQIAFTLDAVEQ